MYETIDKKLKEVMQMAKMPNQFLNLYESFRKDVPSFRNFIEGDSNKTSLKICKNIAKSPATLYNPFFLYGKTGCGKTHLVKAVARELRKEFDMVPLYINSEYLVKELVCDVRENNLYHFYNFYSSQDALIVDNLQYIKGKEIEQAHIFNLAERLVKNNRQVIFVADSKPEDFSELNNSNISDMTVSEIQTPDYSLCKAYLENYLIKNNRDYSENIKNYIIKKYTNNLSLIKGALDKCFIIESILNYKLTLDIVKKHLD